MVVVDAVAVVVVVVVWWWCGGGVVHEAFGQGPGDTARERERQERQTNKQTVSNPHSRDGSNTKHNGDTLHTRVTRGVE